MAGEGYIKLYRSIEEWEWVDSPIMFYFWGRILLLANWEDKMWHNEKVERGSFITSYSKLASTLNLSVQQVRTCIEKLSNSNQITINATSKRTKVIICNYDNYQGDTQDYQHKEQQTNNKQITTTKEKNISVSKDTSYSNKEINNNIESKDSLSTNEIVDLWNSIVVNCSRVTKLSEPRRQKVYSRIKEMGGKEKAREIITTCFNKINNSSFCTGHNDRGWKADFDWFFTNGNNWLKVFEGKYDNRGEMKTEPKKKEYPDGDYWRKDFTDEEIKQLFGFDLPLRQQLLRGYCIQRKNGKWLI